MLHDVMDCAVQKMLFSWVLLSLKPSPGSASCPSGWTVNGSSCYRRFTTKAAWDSAETACVSRGGHLVSITSYSENTVVYNLRGNLSSSSSAVWIGLNDKAVENSFVWSDGTVSSYRRWHDNEPNSSGDCVRMVSGGVWRDRLCSSTNYYVCETSTVTITQAPTTLTATTQAPTTLTATTQAPTTVTATTRTSMTLIATTQAQTIAGLSNCPTGWTRSGLSCFIRIANSSNWYSAEADCQTRGGHLASIASESDNTVVLSVRGTASSSTAVWIGLMKKSISSTFVWSDGTNSSYRSWDSSISEPDGSGNCVMMRYDGNWRDSLCSVSYPYVCEYLLTTSPMTSPTQVATTSGLIATKAAARQKRTTVPATASAAASSVRTTTADTVLVTAAAPTSHAPSTLGPTTASPTSTVPITVLSNTVNSTPSSFTTSIFTIHAAATQISKTLASAPITGRPATKSVTSTTAIETSTTFLPRHHTTAAKLEASDRVGTTTETRASSSSTPNIDHVTVKSTAGNQQESSGGVALYASIGAGVGVCVLVVLLILVIVFSRRRRRAIKHYIPPSHNPYPLPGSSNRTVENPVFEGDHTTQRRSFQGASPYRTAAATMSNGQALNPCEFGVNPLYGRMSKPQHLKQLGHRSTENPLYSVPNPIEMSKTRQSENPIYM